MTGTAAADPVADGAGAQAPATVVLPGMRGGPWNSYMIARNWRTRVIRPGYATIEVDLKHEKAAGDAPRAASRKAKKTRQKERRAKEAGERAASEAERAEPPRAQLRENIQYVMAGLRTAAAQARSQAGSIIGIPCAR
ncbi:hypothetical protein EMIHUDRAFT_234422 [Emiliania huxleyi CCMP1516]|uniref:Uncharacterized protein n=2 Tax=Emiliania huxleyi TaxID=2903 RepID=A0A0D3JZG4_EMIH1|nr:hypothetical protein EMIHUDRAFT_234422 [Emiliania huxleyi CCMP1516]EOD28899.1 hypothetical protein EMIHUDRAFT_234422 [Emiliania huxleyi CCMP1516]|eukprot:XP_005781328.1 hypothetical protein EMIHUDRAFT_234422 [Emiliania huxleyi CCMP1516]